MSEKKCDVNDLRWVRLFGPLPIPSYLVEQIKNKDFSVSDFFKHQEINCIIPGKDGPTLNPFNHLYALVDPNFKVKGYLWFVIDSLSKDVMINTYSLDKSYWGTGKGASIKKLREHIKKITNRLKLKKVYWLTSHPKHSERHGFKRSRSILMEYVEEFDGENNDGEHDSCGESEHADPPATTTV